MGQKKTNSVETTEKVEAKIQTVVLKRGTTIDGIHYDAGSEIEATKEVKALLKPFGYFKS